MNRKTIGWMMIAAAVLGMTALLTGCWDFHKIAEKLSYDPPSFDNRSAYPDGLFYKVWGALEEVARAEISEQGITAIAFEDLNEFEDYCPDVTEGLGCFDDGNVYVFAGVGTDFWDVGTATAHQLAHLYFYQHSDGNDVDGRHAHGEWWDPEVGYVARVRQLIMAGSIQ